MRSLVCVKVDKGGLSPFDASALECSLRLSGWETVILSMGPLDAENTLRGLLRLGADRAVLLSDPVFAGSDTLATAYALSLAAKKLEPDLILCGRQSMSGDTGQVGPELAALLGFPFVPYVLSLELEGLELEIDGLELEVDGLEIKGPSLRCSTREGNRREKFPVLATVERIHTLRLPRAFGRKNSSLEIWDAADIGADFSRCGRQGSPTAVLETFENQQGRRRCTFINPAGLPALIREKRRAGCFPKGPEGRRALKEETAGPRLPEAWVVGGGELEEIASGIAEKTLTLEWMDTRRMAEQIKREKPRVVLWPADWRGRREAARIAALLGAGLCADCISLQTDGRDLFFYRPAWGGNLIGKIRCKTVPAMATVRLRDITEGSLMVSMGMGMRGLEEEVAAYARRLDAELGASRPAVDAGMAPYETQVGLTGRMVSPGVYLSLGISGAAAHTCAIEGAGCVIAVNTDGKARIFEYADYGVVAGGREALAVL